MEPLSHLTPHAWCDGGGVWFDSWDTENVGPHHASSWEPGKRCKWQLVLFCRPLWVKSVCLHRSCQVVLRDELRPDVEGHLSRGGAPLGWKRGPHQLRHAMGRGVGSSTWRV